MHLHTSSFDQMDRKGFFVMWSTFYLFDQQVHQETFSSIKKGNESGWIIFPYGGMYSGNGNTKTSGKGFFHCTGIYMYKNGGRR
ncbi:hypothetical protein EDM56_12640 [Brevibacillus fluminis]|uniref:Uncharacterized protein n=1 Tax=Brevibacillus fluminis TaxID=511487 RepID=A0A3M8DPE4_9BACL|nr:hypothetical protein EDM56_12640 [Brevibacillus fluminis]